MKQERDVGCASSDMDTVVRGSQKEKRGIVARLVRFEGVYAIAMVASWVFSALSGIVSMGTYLYLYRAAEMVVTLGASLNPEELAACGWRALWFAGASFGTYGIALLFSHLAAFNTVCRIRVRLIGHLERVSLGFFSRNTSGELRKTIEESANTVESLIAHQMPDLAQTIVMPFAFLASMFIFDWRMALVCLVPVAVGFASLASMLKSESADLIDGYQAALGEMSASGVEYVRGIGVVKVFGQTVRSFRQFYDSIMRYRDFSLSYVMSMEKPMAIYMTALNSVLIVLIPTAILLYSFGDDPARLLNNLVFFIVFMPLTSLIMSRLMDCSSNLMMASQALDSVEALLAEPVQQRAGTGALPGNFDITFDNVVFRYEQNAPLALDGLTMRAASGEVTALVGASGSGKSTAANLLLRLWDVQEGRICVGGIDVCDIPYAWWMQNCACVFQENRLLKMSIADNVSFCRKGASREEIMRALHEACCDDILEKLPQGVDTVVGSDGVHLSGGEMQRIALARAILQDAPVIVLDEATSFSDPENEHLILRAIERLTQGKTVLMIAHRLSTVTAADKIVVLGAGHALEAGTHEELLAADGVYASMFAEYSRSTAWKIQRETR